MNLDKNLKSWLPFDKTPTFDVVKNNWTVSGNPQIQEGELYLDGASYLQTKMSLGGQSFTVSGFLNVESGVVLDITNESDVSLVLLRRNSGDASKLDFWMNSSADLSKETGYEQVSTIESVGKRVHFELDYNYSAKTMTLFIDGVQAAKRTSSPQFTRSTFAVTIGAYSTGGSALIGTLSEFQIYDGEALHSANFTPPTEEYYRQITFSADVSRKINNAEKNWLYENAGDADNLLLDATILRELPETQSKTGTAFYQTTRAKCFDVPATPEIWLKFDVYFDGSNRWRAYNDKNNSCNGITAQTSGGLTFFANDSNVQGIAGVTKKNQLQTVILHMISGATAGVIEAWVDNEKIYSYTGDVNHGEDFSDLYLQSDGAGTFFSNVSLCNFGVSDAIDFDVERIVETQEHISELFSALKVWLPFDKEPTLDVMDNEWTAFGNPQIQNGGLYLDGASYLQLKNFELGEQDFTIDGWVNMDSSSPANARVVHITNSSGYALLSIRKNSDDATKLDFWVNSTEDVSEDDGYKKVSTIKSVGKRVHFELDYNYWDQVMTLYIDGEQAAQRTGCPQFIRMNYKIAVGALANGNQPVTGVLDEFRIFDGVALHNENFFPPSESYYAFLKKVPIEREYYFDVERVIKGEFKLEYFFDVQRRVIRSIRVPFIGEHFNHFVPSIELFYDTPQKIILPKKSEVYIRALGAGTVRIFSDTDIQGKNVGTDLSEPASMYIKLDECENIFIEGAKTTTPQQIIRSFMKSLKEKELSASSALDTAINFCTNGKFSDNTILVDNFMNDLNSSETYNDFLKNYCDIDLYNADTGAITGWDAGGGTEKTASSIVPEISLEEWRVPAASSTTSFAGDFIVHWPLNGLDGTSFSEAEKHILAGLNSAWISSSLSLIEDSFGLNFREDTVYLKEISIQFYYNSQSTSLADVNYETEYGKTTSMTLYINMYYYKDIDITSPDGALKPSSQMYSVDTYLDRTVVHELTHAVMAANVYNFYLLPKYIKEGAAELVHGIDDTRRAEIINLISSRKSTLEGILRSTNVGSGSDIYVAGYLFFRYLAKQGQSDVFVQDKMELTNLLISDSETNSSYEALTNNTRQILFIDFIRSINPKLVINPDVEVIIFRKVDFEIDIKRNILAKLFLFPRNSEDFFSDETNPYVVQKTKSSLKKAPKLRASSALPQNSEGLQNFEISLAEQQITDQVRFTTILPFDIMQRLSGQYLDYIYNMRVERIQQQGILYSCQCCSDVDQLLFTQMDYDVPVAEKLHKVNDETWQQLKTTREELEQNLKEMGTLASEHVSKIANALGLSTYTNFDDFYSTATTSGVTYNDLVRDIFGWSARVPTQLINVYIRAGQLFVIERGYEAHTIDISKVKMTMPIITKEIVRTTWGATPWSKTITTERQHFQPGDIKGIEKFTPPERESSSGNVTIHHPDDKQSESSFEYNDEGLIKREEIIHEGTDTKTKTITEYSYKDVGKGRKFLARETTYKYEWYGTWQYVGTDITEHTPLEQGQTEHVKKSDDGDIKGSTVTPNSNNDVIIPPTTIRFLKNSNTDSGKTWTYLSSLKSRYEALEQNNLLSDTQKYALQTLISKLDWTQNVAKQMEGEWVTETYEETLTGLSLIDTSFPISQKGSPAKLAELTDALKNLNRKTKETVSVTIYDFEHLIDFNDKIILNGEEYFLASNTARTTPRIKFEQNLQLVRWY